MTKVYTIGIGGPSCSGKTTITRILRRILKNIVVVYQDDFYKPDGDIPIDKETQLENWDCPEAIDFDRFFNVILHTKKNHGKLPKGFDSREENNVHDGSSQLDDDTAQELQHKLSRFIEKESIFIVIDGFMLYWDKRVLNELDCKISLSTCYETLKSRREKRQGYHTEGGYWIDPPGYFDKIVWPEYLQLSKQANALGNVLQIDTDKHSIRDMSLIVADKLNRDLL